MLGSLPGSIDRIRRRRLPDLPGADAKGGPGQMSIAGGCYPAAAGGTPLTAVLINTVATY